MEVSSGLTAQNEDGWFRKLFVALNDDDFLQLVRDDRVPGAEIAFKEGEIHVEVNGARITIAEKFKAMQREADRLLLYQAARERILSPEEARRRIAEL